MLEYGFVHVVLIITSLYLFGFLYAIPGLVIVVMIIDKLLGFFGYTRLSHIDLISSYEYKTTNYHITGYMEIDKITFEEFTDVFIDRALTRIGKLRKVLVFKLGVGLWKDIHIADAMSQIIKDDIVLKSHDEIINYCCKINNKKMDWTKPLWEFRVIENYTNSTSLIVYKIHH